MLAVSKTHRGQGIGKKLVVHAINEMIAKGAEEIVLETEITNVGALRLYERLGFVRDKRLPRYSSSPMVSLTLSSLGII